MPLCCTPANLAELADELRLSEPSTEARYRASCSRAYYAAYHALEPLLKLVPGDEGGVGVQGGLKHREVPRRLRGIQRLPANLARLRRYAAEGRKFAFVFQAALDTREQADYIISEPMPKEEVELQLSRMRDLLEFATTFRAEFERLVEERQ